MFLFPFFFFFFCQNVTWNFHTSLFMKLCNQISKEIHAHKLFWFSASPLPCLHYILAYHWHENSKNICVVSMLFTQANSFILRCNEQYILQGMPNKQDQQSQTNIFYSYLGLVCVYMEPTQTCTNRRVYVCAWKCVCLVLSLVQQALEQDWTQLSGHCCHNQ